MYDLIPQTPAGTPTIYLQALKFSQIVQRLALQCPYAVSVQVEILQGRQPIKGILMDLRDLVLVQEDRMQMHFAGERQGRHIPNVVIAQVSAIRRSERR